MRKTYLWIVALFLLASPVFGFISLPQTSFNISQTNINFSGMYFFDDFTNNGSNVINTSKWTAVIGSGGTAVLSGSGVNAVLQLTGPDNNPYGFSGAATRNNSCIDMRVKRGTDTANVETFRGGTGTGTGDNGPTSRRATISRDNTNFRNGIELDDGTGNERTIARVGDDDYTNITLVINMNGTSQIFINNTHVGINSSNKTWDYSVYSLQVYDNERWDIASFYVYNCSLGVKTINSTPYPRINTTFGGPSNPSNNASDYMGKFLCAGETLNGTICQPWSSANITTYAGANMAITKTNTQIDFLSSSSFSLGIGMFNGSSKTIGAGTACDIQMKYTGTISTNSEFGIKQVAQPFDDGTAGSGVFEVTDGDNNNEWGVGRVGDTSTDTSWGYPIMTTNYTMIWDSTSVMRVCVNNTNTCYEKTGGSWVLPAYFTLFPAAIVTGGNWSITRVACYNATTGAPQQAPPSPPAPALNITFTAADRFDLSAISNYSVAMFQAGVKIHNFTTTNGTIPVSNITNGFYNLTFTSSQAPTGFQGQSYLNVNVSGQFFQGNLTPNAPINPNSSVNGNNFYNILNTSIVSIGRAGAVLLNFTLRDDIRLYGLEFNITKPDGSILLNFTNISLQGTIDNFTRIIDVRGSQGYYTATLVVWDSHTDEVIPDYDVGGFMDTITFNDKITITAEGAIWNTHQKTADSYNFQFQYIPFFAPEVKVFHIESRDGLDYIDDERYKGWFVDWMNKHWIDFEGIEGTPLITKVSDKQYDVAFSNDDSEVSLKSIGGLNSVTYSNSYYISNASLDWYIPTNKLNDNYTNGRYNASINVTGDGRNKTNFKLYNSANVLLNSTNVSNSGTGTYFYNLTFSNLGDDLYFINVSHFDIDVGIFNSTTISITKYFRTYNMSLGGYVNYTSSVNNINTNWTRNLTYQINLTCSSTSTTSLDIYVNGTRARSDSITCSNIFQTSNGTFSNSAEGTFNVTFKLNTTEEINNTILGRIITNFDINNPEIELLNFTNPVGFAGLNTNVSMRCLDSIMPNLTYNVSFNGRQQFNLTMGNNATKTQETFLYSGTNTLNGYCADLFGSDEESQTNTIYATTLVLIDEIDNTAFNTANANSTKIYFDDNSTVFDLGAIGSSSVNFTAGLTNRLRVEIGYDNGDIVTRYIDVSLTGNTTRICANKEGVTHYIQIIQSATQRPVSLESVFATCYVAADYTRFTYQDTLSLKAFTIATQYELNIFEDGVETLLASLDGSVANFQSIDVIEFSQTTYNIQVQTDSLTIQNEGQNLFAIYYNNIARDNTALNITIYRMETNASVYSSATFPSLNNFTLHVDMSSLNNVTNQTLFQVVLTKTTPSGIRRIVAYMSNGIPIDILESSVAIMLSIILVLVGLTTTVPRLAFSYFGIFFELAAIITLTFAPSSWYVIFIGVVETIILIFSIILLIQQNNQTVA